MAVNYIYLNNKLLPPKKALASVIAPGFLYAQGLFETMRVYNGRVFAVDRHIQRLSSSLPTVGMKWNCQAKKIKQAIEATLKANRLKNGYVRLTVWQAEREVNLCIRTKKYLPYTEKMYRKGFSAIVSPYRQNELSPLSAVKSTNYLLNLLAREDAQKKGHDEAILLNTQGAVCEGSRTNIFLVKSGRLITPDLKQGCLKGITRKIVLELARKNQIRTYERKISLQDLLNSDEAFLTNSLMEIMPLVKVSNKNIGKGKPGRITRFLLKRYRDLVKKATEK